LGAASLLLHLGRLWKASASLQQNLSQDFHAKSSGAFSFLNVDIFNIYIQEKKSHRGAFSFLQ
jgi:hypothetical protein